MRDRSVVIGPIDPIGYWDEAWTADTTRQGHSAATQVDQ